MQMSLAVNSTGYLYCKYCRAPIFEKCKYVLVDGSEYHIVCFKSNVEQFLKLIEEN